MRSFVTPIALSLVLTVSSMSEGQARRGKHEDNDRKVPKITQVKGKNETTITEEYSTGSTRVWRIIRKSDGRSCSPFGYAKQPIILGKTKHHDGTTTYSFSGVNFEDIPVQGPKKRRKIAAEDEVTSLVNVLFSSGKNLKGKEKISTKEIDDLTDEFVEDLFSAEPIKPNLRAWTKLPSVPKAKKAHKLRSEALSLQKDIEEGIEEGKKRKIGDLYEKTEALKNWGQIGLNKYVGPRYEKISKEFPTKSRRWVRLKRDRFLKTPEEAKNYLEARHKKLKVEFPTGTPDQMSNLIPTRKAPKALKAPEARKALKFRSMLDELSDADALSDTSTYSRDEGDEDGYNDVSWMTDAFNRTQD